MEGADQPFKSYWASKVYPVIKDDYERLLKTAPTRIAEKDNKKKEKKSRRDDDDTDRVQEKIVSVLKEVEEKGERRNTYMNLTWTGPIDNSYLEEKITVGKVENMAADLFLTNQPGGEEAATAPSSQEAGDDAEPPQQGKAERRAVEVLKEKASKPWNIPERVEKGFEIPIRVTEQYAPPELGKFKRLGMDVVVNAVWLAYYWAKKKAPRMLQQHSRR